jgi:hypothetical protein
MSTHDEQTQQRRSNLDELSKLGVETRTAAAARAHA